MTRVLSYYDTVLCNKRYRINIYNRLYRYTTSGAIQHALGTTVLSTNTQLTINVQVHFYTKMILTPVEENYFYDLYSSVQFYYEHHDLYTRERNLLTTCTVEH